MTKDIDKPDGFVAWHPEKGVQIRTIGADENKAWYNLRTSFVFIPEDGPPMIEAIKSNGWKIRPVKLLFLDSQDQGGTKDND